MLLKILLPVLGCVPLVIGEPIVGGRTAEVGKYPYLASLLLFSDGTHICGASIISCSWMLTAAHCIASNRQNNVELIYARVGITKLSEKGDMYNLKSGIVHEKYRSYRKNNDVAVLQTEKKMILSSKVAIISLARMIPADGVTATLAGWGGTENDLPSDTLQVIQLKLMNLKECKDMYRKANPVDPVTAEEHICVIETTKTGMQGGDSGGPLAYKNTQIGIVSFIAQFIGLPGVYVSVPKFISWIEGKTGISENNYLC